jgi:hypothetical protein
VRDPRWLPDERDPRPHALALPKRVNPRSVGDRRSAYR